MNQFLKMENDDILHLLIEEVASKQNRSFVLYRCYIPHKKLSDPLIDD